MQQQSARVLALRAARERPELFIGTRDALAAIRNVLEVCLETEAFGAVTGVHLWLSDYSYLALAQGGPLREDIAALVPWDETDSLCEVLPPIGTDLQYRAASDPMKWLSPFLHVHFGSFVSPFLLAERAVLAIRTPGGTWCQTYHQGWPTTPPFQSGRRAGSSLVVGAELSPSWFTNLPLSPGRIRGALPAAVTQRVRMEGFSGSSVSLPEVTVRSAIEIWLERLAGSPL
jgi:hypothetical protein